MNSKNILDHFSELTDPREDNKRHKLMDIITIVLCASICGAEKWDDIETFGRAKENWLQRYLELPHGIPSHDTLARVFALLDPEQFNRRFLSWIRFINPHHEKEIINIDGKTLRRSHGEGKSAIHMISAWANKAGLTLGQVKTDEKSNEITAIPELLELLELHGCIVTIDAVEQDFSIATFDYHKTVDKDHGRIEIRGCWVTDDID